MKAYELIKHKDIILAHIFRKKIGVEGTKFLTPEDYTLQLGVLVHPKGTTLKDHAHNPKIKYNVDTTQEFLYIVEGKVKVKFFSNSWEKVAVRILRAGDFMLHVGGGHGFEILENSKMIEVKQGPYPGDSKAKIYKET